MPTHRPRPTTTDRPPPTGHVAEFDAIHDAYVADLAGVPSARTTVHLGLPAGPPADTDALAVLG